MDRKRILVADQTASVRGLLEGVFGARGHEVIAVDSGDTAMAAFVTTPPDLVFADVDLPGTSGVKICEIIKQDPENRTTPVILMAEAESDYDAAQAGSVGANAFFTKPFASIPDLVAEVNGLLGGTIPREKGPSDIDDIDSLYVRSFEESGPALLEELDSGSVDEGTEVELASEEPRYEIDGTDPDEIGPLKSRTQVDRPSVLTPPPDLSLDDQTIEISRPGVSQQSVMNPFDEPASVALEKPLNEEPTLRAPSTINKIDPELIDEIVRRVVERLSDSVIREIAQEKMPEITKMLLSEALERDQILKK